MQVPSKSFDRVHMVLERLRCRWDPWSGKSRSSLRFLFNEIGACLVLHPDFESCLYHTLRLTKIVDRKWVFLEDSEETQRIGRIAFSIESRYNQLPSGQTQREHGYNGRLDKRGMKIHSDDAGNL